jgi:hypothetical protein
MKQNEKKYSHTDVTEKLKQSIMSDDFIDKVICLHNHYPDSFNEMIFNLNDNFKRFINCGYSVIDTYEILKENRIVRCSEDDSLMGFEKNLLKILIECFTEYRTEILSYELLRNCKTIGK